MKKIHIVAMIFTLLVMLTGTAGATAFTFDAPEMNDSYTNSNDVISLRVNPYHDMFNSDRGKSPLLTMPTPDGNWVFTAKFQMPMRTDSTHTGLVIWNGKNTEPCYALYVGPYNKDQIRVEGSYSAVTSGWPSELRAVSGNSGSFETDYTNSTGWLRIVKQGYYYTFYCRATDDGNWFKIGSIKTDDQFNSIGFIAKSWADTGIETKFSNITIEPLMDQPVNTDSPKAVASISQPTTVNSISSTFTLDAPSMNDTGSASSNTASLRVNGYHDTFNASRGKSPFLTMPAPAGNWAFTAKFQIPFRTDSTHAGMAIWNGNNADPSYALYVGPYNKDQLHVEGSYSAAISGWPSELRAVSGNSGSFETDYTNSTGWVKIVKQDNTYSFYCRIADEDNWFKLGSIKTDDQFNRIGFIAKSWGDNSLQINFSNISLNPL